MKRFAAISLMGAAFATVSGSVLAAGQQLNATMNVTADVTASCTNVSTGDMNFGTAGQLDMDDVQTVAISVTCDNGATYTVELDYGIQPNATLRQLADASSGEFMDYDIYQPNATGGQQQTTLWGTAANSEAYAHTGSGAAQTLTATGVLHRASGTSPGTYSDAVSVTLNF